MLNFKQHLFVLHNIHIFVKIYISSTIIKAWALVPWNNWKAKSIREPGHQFIDYYSQYINNNTVPRKVITTHTKIKKIHTLKNYHHNGITIIDLL